MAQENGSPFKLVYSNWLNKDGKLFPIANGMHSAVNRWIVKFFDKIPADGIHPYLRHGELDDCFQENNNGYFFRHTVFLQYFLEHVKQLESNVVNEDDIDENDDIQYLYPIELERRGVFLVTETPEISVDGAKYNYSFLETLSPKLRRLMKSGKVKITFSNLFDPYYIDGCLKTIEDAIESIGIDASNIIFIQGNVSNEYFSNTRKLKSIRTSGILSLRQAANLILTYPQFTNLGYVSDVVKVSDLDKNIVRPKKFLCFNRMLNRPHRISTLYAAIKYNLFKDNYFSFVSSLSDDIENSIKACIPDATDIIEISQIMKKNVPYELDTQHLPSDQKNSFASVENNKKDLYLQSYIQLVSETMFGDERSPFFSEKIWRPIINMQPFIVMGSQNSLYILKSLGFKTFSPFIDESYDTELDPVIRFKKIMDEVVRINNMDIKEIHEWYYSIVDKLIYNQILLTKYAHYNPLGGFFTKKIWT